MPQVHEPPEDEATYLKHEFIPFLMRQLQDAQERLKQLDRNGKTIQPAQETDPPKNGVNSSRTV